MTIAFIHNPLSFLPEVHAYHRFFKSRGFQTLSIDQESWKSNGKDYDVEWFFMGLDYSKRTDAFRIHEYASASIPPFASLKNQLKSRFNTAPDFRLFLNEYVKNSFSFNDDIPFGYRDMGIDIRPYTPLEKEYDFIYTGSVAKDRNLEPLLNCFKDKKMAARTLLVLSQHYTRLQKKYSGFSNIIFKGPVPYEDVAGYLNRSSFAINYVPDREPYNRQTSTKLLEYIQQGIPVITTDYEWIRQFEKSSGGRFFYLDKNLENLNWEKINAYSYSSPNLDAWSWEKQIQRSGVIEALNELETKRK